MASEPSLAELARTTVARARVATVAYPRPGIEPGMRTVAMRADHTGRPLLPSAGGSGPIWHRLLRAWVRVSVAAGPHFTALTLTGTVQEYRADDEPAYLVAPRTVCFTGPERAPVPLPDYYACAPDPLWHDAPRMLHHLAAAHILEMLSCVRAHGLADAEWVSPRCLDRYGLELTALTPRGATRVRLPFSNGPIGSLNDIPAAYRCVLTCRCRPGPP